MSNRWNQRDILRLTRDCELGETGDTLLVVAADGPYMTVRRGKDGTLEHTGRGYVHARKIGEGAVDDATEPTPSSDSREALAKLVRVYLAARDEFDDCDIIAEPKRAHAAAREMEKAEAILREAAEIPGEPGKV